MRKVCGNEKENEKNRLYLGKHEEGKEEMN